MAKAKMEIKFSKKYKRALSEMNEKLDKVTAELDSNRKTFRGFHVASPDINCLRQAKINFLQIDVVPRKEKIGGGILLIFWADEKEHRMLLDEEAREHLIGLLSAPMEPINIEQIICPEPPE